jgi:hypothetical protein
LKTLKAILIMNNFHLILINKAILILSIVFSLTTNLTHAQESSSRKDITPKPTEKDWSDLAKLPDWSGTWNPKITDQDRQVKTNMPPWKSKAGEIIQFQLAEEKAGRPPPIFVNCLPEGMPSWMLISHNSMEILMTPGRVTLLGESDGNRIRRIYTDGRQHPEDPEPTFHGHSVGHWEGDTLVVDTVGVLPQAYLAVSEAAGVPNNGNLHVTERIRLSSKDMLEDQLEITAPEVLTKPWKTTRLFFRQRAHKFDIVEGVCLQGSFKPSKDKDGFDVYEPIPMDVGGNRIPPSD